MVIENKGMSRFINKMFKVYLNRVISVIFSFFYVMEYLLF